MRIVIQRVSRASVCVDGSAVSQIGCGLMILVGVENGDTEEDAAWLASKAARLRIFDDVLAVSQFTLTASTRKGNRPSYIRAAGHETAVPLYERFCQLLERECGVEVKRGIFGADMQVELVNDGPVTIIIDSRLRE